MKRTVLAIRNRLILEAVTLALKKAGFCVARSTSQDEAQILLACEATYANLLVMDVARSGDGTYESRAETVQAAKRKNPDLKIALLCDNVSDGDVAYKVKRAKEEGLIDACFYESVPSDYLVDALDSL